MQSDLLRKGGAMHRSSSGGLIEKMDGSSTIIDYVSPSWIMQAVQNCDNLIVGKKALFFRRRSVHMPSALCVTHHAIDADHDSFRTAS
jgi:hypothetical protein